MSNSNACVRRDVIGYGVGVVEGRRGDAQIYNVSNVNDMTSECPFKNILTLVDGEIKITFTPLRLPILLTSGSSLILIYAQP